jgi:hypothetical protein
MLPAFTTGFCQKFALITVGIRLGPAVQPELYPPMIFVDLYINAHFAPEINLFCAD